jgi:hypothetical protein
MQDCKTIMRPSLREGVWAAVTISSKKLTDGGLRCVAKTIANQINSTVVHCRFACSFLVNTWLLHLTYPAKWIDDRLKLIALSLLPAPHD